MRSNGVRWLAQIFQEVGDMIKNRLTFGVPIVKLIFDRMVLIIKRVNKQPETTSGFCKSL